MSGRAAVRERTTLRLLVERMERALAHLSKDERRQLKAGGEDEEQLAARGLLHMFAALEEARAALASDDDDRIRQAAVEAPPFARHGAELAAKFAEKERDEVGKALAERRGGGQAASAQQRRATINALAAPMIEAGLSRKEIAGRIAGDRSDLGAEAQIRRLIDMPRGRT